MKRISFLAPVLAKAIVMAIGSAFATKAKPLTTVYKDSFNPAAPCAIENECILTIGRACDHVVYKFNDGEGGTCTTPTDLKRP